MLRFFFLLFFTTHLFALNHLAKESSPYLQQHKNNPINWYPWTKEAFQKAKKEHKPIFLSIGYSTCHWCHVMMRESFEDKKVAEFLNKYYISIKVDKEEYPQIDQYYQKIYQQFRKKSGGWPLTIILSPEKKPLFAATYIPRFAGYGSPGILTILKQIKNNLHQLSMKNINLHLNSPLQTSQFPKNFISYAFYTFRSIYDKENGGFGNKQKFPSASMLKTLLEIYKIKHIKSALLMVEKTLDIMAKSGLYDQIEGGFFRYSTDKKWEIPHFEKMLYTNAELIEVYTQAYLLTKKPLYKKVVQESISMVDTRFLLHGVYMSASNAESKDINQEEHEGIYFLYTYDQTLEYLLKHGISKKDAKQGLKHLSIQEEGNFDGDLSHAQISATPPPKNIQTIKQLLKDMRKDRPYPFIDYKINTAWNALYITAKLKASKIDLRYAHEALYSLEKLLEHNYKNGILYHTSVKGYPLKQKALLEDYAFMIQTLLSAYQLTLQNKYLILAKQFFDKSRQLFYKDDRWYLSRDKMVHASLQDEAYRNPLASLLQSGLFFTATQDHKLKNFLLKTIYSYVPQIEKAPPYYATALEFYLQNHYGIYIIKSKKENLRNISTYKFDYPFIYKFITKNNKYELCGINRCFLLTSDPKELKNKLQTIMKNNN